MTEKTVYIADDGSRWDEREDAEARDRSLASIRVIMSDLPPIPQNGHFKAGAGFLQHSPGKIKSVKERLVELSRPLLENVPTGKNKKPDPIHWHAGEFIGHLPKTAVPVLAAWQRLSCVDEFSREWVNVAAKSAKNPNAICVNANT